MPTLQLHHMTTDEGTYANEHPLAVCLIGIRHSRSFSHYCTVAQVPHCGDQLLHQMGQGQTISHYHEEERS